MSLHFNCIFTLLVVFLKKVSFFKLSLAVIIIIIIIIMIIIIIIIVFKIQSSK